MSSNDLPHSDQRSSSPILELEGLCKTYDNGTQALKNVNLKVYPGEFLVVIGLSGSGKSTLLRCINRLHEPSSGKIRMKQEDITHLSPTQIRQLRQKVAMIFQHFNLIPRHSVLSNVLMGNLPRVNPLLSLLGVFPPALLQKAHSYLELVGISSKKNMRADQLSGGQQQRVAIARALAQEPEILLADEPVASLDPATCHVVMDYLKKVNQELGITIICNLHFLSLVRQYATRVVALRGGEVVFEGSPQQIDEAWFSRIYGDFAREVHVQ